MAVLVLADHDNVSLKSATLHAVAAATRLGADVHVLVAGAGSAPAAQAAAAVAGVTRVLHADAPHLGAPTAENVAATALQLVQAGGYTHVLASATGFGKNIAPRLAALLDVAQISEITAIESADTFVRPIYAGNAFATVQSKDAIKVITVRATSFDGAAATGGSAPVDSVAAAPDTGLSAVTGQELTQSDRPELTAARIVVAGGRGLGSGDKFNALLEPLADKLDAAMGASRAAVDAGYVPNDYQVGQTGQGRRAGSLHRRRHLRRDPAPRRHEGQQGDRRDQQGPGGADLPGRRLRPRRRPVRAGARVHRRTRLTRAAILRAGPGREAVPEGGARSRVFADGRAVGRTNSQSSVLWTRGSAGTVFCAAACSRCCRAPVAPHSVDSSTLRLRSP